MTHAARPLRCLAIVAALSATAGSASAQQQMPEPTLKVGDAAPPLSIGKWVKGEPVKSFDPGTAYVLECWATWCGPCIAAIPHVTELQKKFDGKLVVIGMNVFEQDEAKVAPFVEKMGDKMAYRVATDDKSKNPEGAMSQTWMAAAGRNSIPTSFVIDKAGKIAWIGHPMEMEPIIEAVIAGTYDPKAQAAKEDEKKAIIARIESAAKAEDVDAALAAIDELAKADPSMAKQLTFARFQFLLQAKRYDQAYAKEDALVEAFAEQPAMLGQIAAIVTMAPGLETRDLSFARRMADRAVTQTDRKEPALIDLLARVTFEQGDAAKAIEIEREAISAAGDNEKAKAAFQANLEKYEKAASTQPTTAPTMG